MRASVDSFWPLALFLSMFGRMLLNLLKLLESDSPLFLLPARLTGPLGSCLDLPF